MGGILVRGQHGILVRCIRRSIRVRRRRSIRARRPRSTVLTTGRLHVAVGLTASTRLRAHRAPIAWSGCWMIVIGSVIGD